MACSRVIAELKGTRKGRLKYATELNVADFQRQQTQLDDALQRLTCATEDIEQNPLVAQQETKQPTRIVPRSADVDSPNTSTESADRAYSASVEVFVRQRLLKLKTAIDGRLASLESSQRNHQTRRFRQKTVKKEPVTTSERSPSSVSVKFAGLSPKVANINDSMCNFLPASPHDDSIPEAETSGGAAGVANYAALGAAISASIGRTDAQLRSEIEKVNDASKRNNFVAFLTDLNAKADGAETLLGQFPEMGISTLQQIDYEMKQFQLAIAKLLQRQSTDSLPSLSAVQQNEETVEETTEPKGGIVSISVVPDLSESKNDEEESDVFVPTELPIDPALLPLPSTAESTVDDEPPPVRGNDEERLGEVLSIELVEEDATPTKIEHVSPDTSASVIERVINSTTSSGTIGTYGIISSEEDAESTKPDDDVSLGLVSADGRRAYEMAMTALNAVRTSADVFEHSTADGRRRGQLKMLLNTRISQTTAIMTAEEAKQEARFFIKVLSGRSVPNYKGDQMISIGDSTAAVAYCNIFVVQRYLRLIEQNEDVAVTTSRVLLEVSASVAGFAAVLRGLLFEQCPLLIPYYRSDLLKLKAADKQTAIAKQTALLKFGAQLALTYTNDTPLDLGHIWSVLVEAGGGGNLRVCGTLTALVLRELLRGCDLALRRAYGRQYRKLLTLAYTKQLPLISKTTRDDAHAIAAYRRLKETLEKIAPGNNMV